MRTCYACKQEKPATEFWVTSRMCKPCHKAYDKLRPYRAGKHRNNSTEAARARKRRYVKKGLHPERVAARAAVKRALNAGILKRQTSCEVCGNSPKRKDGVTAVQAHHDDYSKPLVVRWLCVTCHTKWHKENDAAIEKEKA